MILRLGARGAGFSAAVASASSDRRKRHVFLLPCPIGWPGIFPPRAISNSRRGRIPRNSAALSASTKCSMSVNVDASEPVQWPVLKTWILGSRAASQFHPRRLYRRPRARNPCSDLIASRGGLCNVGSSAVQFLRIRCFPATTALFSLFLVLVPASSGLSAL